MSFHFPNFNIPPPVFHPTEDKIQLFLLQRSQSNRTFTEPWTISKFKSNLHRVNELRTHQTAEAEKIVEKIKDEKVITEVKRKIEQRRRKRAWFKRRRAKIKDDIHESLKARMRKHAEIDKKLQEINKKFTEAQKIEEGRMETEKNLAQIKKQIHQAEKQLKFFDSLLELRRLRLQNQSRQDTNIHFEASITELIRDWVEVLSQLRTQHEELNDFFLQTYNRKQYLEDQWDRTLFGEKLSIKIDHPLLKAEKNIGDFLDVRRKWDACIDDEGSTIPIFWVLPNENPNTEWVQCRSF